jgi:hypothetical protein
MVFLRSYLGTFLYLIWERFFIWKKKRMRYINGYEFRFYKGKWYRTKIIYGYRKKWWHRR